MKPNKPTPDYEAPGIQLYLADSATILPHLDQVDLLVTDPPYGVAFQSSWRTDTFAPILNDLPSDQPAIQAIVAQAVDVLRVNRHVYSFGPAALIATHPGLSSHAQLVWQKGHGMGDLSLPWAPAHELINFAVKSGRKEGGKLSARLRQGSVLSHSKPRATRHPTEKPVALLQQLIESSSCIGETVLDPFMGVGSTAIAALLEGRSFIGIELDPGYFAIAVERVKAILPILQALKEAA